MSALAERKVEDSPSVGEPDPEFQSIEGGAMNGIEVTITLTPESERWIQEQIATGQFLNRSYVIDDAIWQIRDAKRIHEHLIRAEQSGMAPKQTCEEMIAEFEEKARANGKI